MAKEEKGKRTGRLESLLASVTAPMGLPAAESTWLGVGVGVGLGLGVGVGVGLP